MPSLRCFWGTDHKSIKLIENIDELLGDDIKQDDMPNAFFNRDPRFPTSQAKPDDERNPLRELESFKDEDELTEEEREVIGDLGNDNDIAIVYSLINQIEAWAPSRPCLLMHRVV